MAFGLRVRLPQGFDRPRRFLSRASCNVHGCIGGVEDLGELQADAGVAASYNRDLALSIDLNEIHVACSLCPRDHQVPSL